MRARLRLSHHKLNDENLKHTHQVGDQKNPAIASNANCTQLQHSYRMKTDLQTNTIKNGKASAYGFK